ncbi:Autoinducer 2 sensor kinase/phosphatase LuxQ [Lacunisphaera limnophila]|uniref:histidine kinase n=1 Tax=Lacunisphaera limnophila TaxID=1838286 RepID=A0A1D8ASX2_9BACT|nr:ATP-binding protein [Lacunisphaera limnophila]AOS43993.1 Autoinducer 2 sensor kinase/phosphatase LuxQ [Lacunisphaera limnophila]
MSAEGELLREEIALLRRQLERERLSREQAEQLAEQGTRALYDRQAELALLAAITSAANSSATLTSAVASVLQQLGEFGGWELGHVYVNEPGTDTLVPLGLWYEANPGRCRTFQARTGELTLRRGAGLPGQVMARGEPLLLTSLADECNFPRAEAAQACGLVCGYAFPVTPSVGGMAVIELFSIRRHAPDEPMLGLIPQVTSQINRIFARHWLDRERQRVQVALEEKVRERTETLSKTVQALNERVEEQRRMQQALQVHNRALNAAANGIVIADALQPNWPIIYCNPAFERLTGYQADEVMGRNCKFLQGDDTDTETVGALRDAIRTGQPVNVTIKNYRKDGTSFWNQLTVAPVRDPTGLLTHYIGVQEDVTRQQEAEHSLRAARDATELANADLSRAARLKDEFLAAMSHELRTPLNAVLGMAEVMRDQLHGPLNASQLEMMGIVEESGRHLLALINDILDLSKIEAGKLDLQVEEVPIEPAAQSSVRFVREQAMRKKLELTCTVDPTLETVQADHRRLKQVLVNLLSNAVKFTPEGGRVGLEVVADPVAGGVRFTVWDTGIGIARADFDRIFQPFEQIDSRLARRYEGTGLGLALVRRMVAMHGGTLSLDSEPGQGSRFSVFLPQVRFSHPPIAVTPGQVPAPAARPRVPNGAIHVLVAEDNEANQKMLLGYLQAQGYRTSLATQGEEAVQMATALCPDIIVMDVQMPGVDGLEAIRRIRADPQVAHIPIIALTAMAMNGDRDRCIAAGASAYLSKPVMLSELAACLDQVVAVRSGPAPLRQDGPAQRLA